MPKEEPQEKTEELNIKAAEKIITEYETRWREYKIWIQRHLDRQEEDKLDQVTTDAMGLNKETIPMLRHIFEQYKLKAEELERRKGKIDEVRRAAIEAALKED